ncbi:MAG: hypothetical protein QOD86_1179 [Miltoncostaeaceae bacterium]|jgi:hypothetical protein|nr:hypothetical protein [Miltoncostaeaceae bacterium]
MGVVRQGAVAGAAAAAAWAALEPLAARALGTDYSDARLLGRLIRPHGTGWRAAGLAAHVANGAVAGALFARAGLRGPLAGVAAASIEGLAVWPGMAMVDRVHPDVRSGRWPRLLTDRRVFAQEAVMHGLFGALLGLGVRRSP